MVTRTNGRVAAPPLTDVKVTIGATTYSFLARSAVQRIQVNDSPPYVPTSGQQSVQSRSYHNIFSIKDIKNDFAHEFEHRFAEHGGVIDHLYDCEMCTLFGTIYFPSAENNPTNPATVQALSIFASPVADATTANMNPKMPKYYQGSANTGVFCLRSDSAANGNPAEIECERWPGTTWANTLSDLMVATSSAFAYDVVVHKGELTMLFGNASVVTVNSSTNGSTSTVYTNLPGGSAQMGARLMDDGNTLWLFQYNSNTVTVKKTTDKGATAWTTAVSNVVNGQLRDVDWFMDNTSSHNLQIMLLMKDALYWYDRTNSVVQQLLRLPYEGRAIIPFRVNGMPALLIFLDGMKVYAYFADGSTWDISPGGSQGMPAGKDFGLQSSGQVCVTSSAQYAYGLWSGTDNGGTVLRPLCLAFDGNVEIRDGKVISAGWHFIWRKGDTSISAAARYIFLDPQSQDLVLGIQDATAEATTHVRLKDVEVPPPLQSTRDRKTSGSFILPRQDFGSPLVSTTIWDVFQNTNGLGTSKSIQISYRTNGSTGAYTNVGSAVTTDNSLVTFTANAANDVGLNFRDVQLQFTFAANAVTDAIAFFSFDVGYARIWPVRYIHVVDFVIEPQPPLGQTSAKATFANLTTIAGTATKVLLTYSKEIGTVAVLPLPESKVVEIVRSGYAPSAVREGDWRMAFIEA